MFGRLCHGRERRPLEPYGTLAPFLRMVAAGLTFVGALAGVVLLVAIQVPVLPLIAPSVVAGGGSLPVAMGVRWLAGAVRPNPISPVAVDFSA
ncbi:MAG TPA: hypothetical protein VNA20_05670 [Frankiaceae bacterium]|nr:hypothetical protein [Frankiaceae bacterium]